MAETALATIKRLIPTLDATELGQVKGAIKALESVSGQVAPEIGDVLIPHTNTGTVLDVLCETLGAAGIEHTTPFLLRRASGFKAFEEKLPGVMKFLAQATRNKIELRALLTLAIGLLYDDLVQMGITVSGRTMLAHIHRIPAVVNQQFPGYAQSGMLLWVIKRGK